MQVSTITEKTMFQRNQALEFNQIDGDILITSGKDNCCYGLGSIESTIWNILAEPCQLALLIKKLTDEYAVSYNKCLEDVAELLNTMYDRKLIIVVK